jgi:hypothetical protein
MKTGEQKIHKIKGCLFENTKRVDKLRLIKKKEKF